MNIFLLAPSFVAFASSIIPGDFGEDKDETGQSGGNIDVGVNPNRLGLIQRKNKSNSPPSSSSGLDRVVEKSNNSNNGGGIGSSGGGGSGLGVGGLGSGVIGSHLTLILTTTITLSQYSYLHPLLSLTLLSPIRPSLRRR